MDDTARRRAMVILNLWESRGVPLDLVVAEELQLPLDDPRENQFCRALVYGVARWRGYLDEILSRYAKHPLAKMKPLLKQGLRCAIYQLVAMDRVPPSAAINETVQILKEAGEPRWLTGFANGVLRRIGRELAKLPAPGAAAEFFPDWPRPALLSHPEWLYHRWCRRYGEETAEAVCRADNQEPTLTLRATSGSSREELREMLRAAGYPACLGSFAPAAVLLESFRGPVTLLPGYREGRFQVQDEAAQLVSLILAPQGDGRYLDACAGLGGKTTHLVELLPADGTLVAVEPEERRLGRLAENLQRLHLADRVEVFAGTLAQLAARGSEKFRGILVDAPCSGLGVIRRHPDIRWNRQVADLDRYQDGQLSLLKQAADLLAPDGILVYAVCSNEPEENEQVIEKFLAARPGLAIENCREFLHAGACGLVDTAGFFRSRPDQGLDGFFAARLRKFKSGS